MVPSGKKWWQQLRQLCQHRLAAGRQSIGVRRFDQPRPGSEFLRLTVH